MQFPIGRALTTADWRAALALVGEVGELGTSPPTEACGHLMARLAALIGAGSVWWNVTGEAVQTNGGTADATGPVARSQVHGLDGATLQRWEQGYLVECRYQEHPMWRQAFATPGRPRFYLRRELVDDRAWYRSTHIRDWARAFGFDDVVSAIVPIGSGAEVCIAASRPWGDIGFGVRERDLLAVLATHTAWLGRRPAPALPRAGSQAGIAGAVDLLAPRHRAVLELLVTGRSEKQVAAALGLSPRTAHKYIEQIYRALNVSSRAELMALFITR